MADSSSESYFHSDIFGLRHISSSFPSIPGLFVGFTTKSPSDSDSVRSPTSPLDFKFFSNLSNSFNLKSPRSAAPNRKWDCSEVGLGIVNSIAGSKLKSCDEAPILQHKHIIFGRQVKDISTLDQNSRGSSFYPVKSKSLPRNYAILPERKAGSPQPSLDSTKPEMCRSRSLDTGKSCSSVVKKPEVISLPSEEFAARTMSEKALDVKEASLPIPVGRSNEHLPALSAGEIELSEDYTCIISYGPNSKTTHIFSDRVLEYYTTNNSSDSRKEEHGAGMSQLLEPSEKADPHPSEEQPKFCYSCSREILGKDESHTDGFEKVFCSKECQAKSIQQNDESISENSSSPCYHEDLFLMGIPFAA